MRVLLLCLVLMGCLTDGLCQTCEFTQPTPTCPPFPTIRNINRSSSEIIPGRGLGPFLNIAVKIQSMNWNDLSKIVGTVRTANPALSNIGSQLLPIAKSLSSLIAGLVFGILLAVLVPIIGLFFCCCRICGNCGGKMMQKKSASKRAGHVCLLSILVFVFATLTLTGGLIVISAGGLVEQGAVSLQQYPTEMTTFLSGYIDDLIVQLQVLQSRLLSGIDAAISQSFVISTLNTTKASMIATLRKSFDQIIQLKTNISLMYVSAGLLSNATLGLMSRSRDISGLVSNISAQIIAINSNCSTSCVRNGSLPDMKSLFIANLSQAEKDLAVFNSWDPVKERTDSEAILTLLFANMSSKVADTAASIKDSSSSFVNTLQTLQSNLKSSVHNFSNTVNSGTIKSFTSYDVSVVRQVIVLIGAIVATLACFFLLGLVCGLCGHKTKRSPAKRGFLSHCGGQLIMSGVGLTFILYFFLMIISTLVFIVCAFGNGACKFFEDSAQLVELLKIVSPGNYSQIVGEIFMSKEKTVTIYSLLKLSNMVSLDSLFNTMDNLNVSGVQTALSSYAISQLVVTRFVSSDVNGLNKTYNRDTADLNKMGNQFLAVNTSDITSDLIDALKNKPNQSALINQTLANLDLMNQMIGLAANQLASTKTTIKDYDRTFLALIKSAQDTVVSVSDTNQLSKTYFSNQTAAITQGIQNKSSTVIRFLSNHVKSLLESEIGVVRPLYNLLDYTINGLICKRLVLSLNGVWLGIGWAMIFSLFSIIFGVRLVKYFRRMNVKVSDTDRMEMEQMEKAH